MLTEEVNRLENGIPHSAEKSYWKGDTSEPLKTITIGQLIRNSADKFADQIAVSMFEGEKLSYYQVDKRANMLAAAFLSLGLKKGDHIAIWGFNSIEWYISFLAAMKMGMVTVNVNPHFQPPELESCLLLSDSKALIMYEINDERSLHEKLCKVIPEINDFDSNMHIQTEKLPMLRTVITSSHRYCKGTYNWNKLLDNIEDEQQKLLLQLQTEVNIFDVCNIQFTSGTTSASKAVLLTHYNLVNNAYWIGKNLQLNENSQKLCALPPFFHAYGLAVGIIASIWFGATTIMPYNKYSPIKVIPCIIEERCNLIYGTPTMFVDFSSNLKSLAQQDTQIYQKLSSVQRMFTGGATCLPDIIDNMKKHFPQLKVTSGYGMTELSPVTFISMPNESPSLASVTIGRLLDHMEVKLVDQNSEIVPLGCAGELCFRGYMVMKGYYKNPEKTNEVIDEDGWFYTGDRAILMENGYAQIVGRIKDTIIRGGENIEPKEVEEVIMKHKGVMDVQVFGVRDDRLGEVVAASIVREEKSNVNEEDIRKFCSGVIASYKIPRYITFCKEYPKTASGKIQKFKLRHNLEKELGMTDGTN